VVARAWSHDLRRRHAPLRPSGHRRLPLTERSQPQTTVLTWPGGHRPSLTKPRPLDGARGPPGAHTARPRRRRRRRPCRPPLLSGWDGKEEGPRARIHKKGRAQLQISWLSWIVLRRTCLLGLIKVSCRGLVANVFFLFLFFYALIDWIFKNQYLLLGSPKNSETNFVSFVMKCSTW
jgi:hypothetical protein